MIFVLDNYDSFVYNLVQYFEQLGEKVVVKRNREITPEEVLELNPKTIILSPGPGEPKDAGIMPDLIKKAFGKIPIFGVCLGHQALGNFYGMQVIPAKKIMHGKVSSIKHDGKGIFSGIIQNCQVVRYHSLALSADDLPENVEITATTEDGEIMGLRHKNFLVESVQYHPESILTTTGKMQIANFLKLVNNLQK